jgi:hypothetical protein
MQDDYRAERAARAERQDNAERFREASHTIEVIANWLGEVWDDYPDECDAEQRDRAETIAATLQTALAPHAAEIIAYERRERADFARRGVLPLRAVTLFGTTLRGELS